MRSIARGYGPFAPHRRPAVDPVFARTVTDIYTGLKDIPFYSVLGNHDCA